jgi:hypothetical protein
MFAIPRCFDPLGVRVVLLLLVDGGRCGCDGCTASWCRQINRMEVPKQTADTFVTLLAADTVPGVVTVGSTRSTVHGVAVSSR